MSNEAISLKAHKISLTGIAPLCYRQKHPFVKNFLKGRVNNGSASAIC
jgi:hypothetical protein